MTPVVAWRTAGLAILAGLAWFVVLMGASIGLVMLNARRSPGLPWFPVPVLALCIGTAVFAERRWKIGLSHPPGVDWSRIYLLGITTMVFGVCVSILQGAAYGLTREAETGPEGTSEAFRFAYAFTMPLVAAILAEVAFRGIMQGRIHTVMSPLATILLVSAVNTASHRWGPGLVAQWFAYFVLLVGVGWIRWLGNSVVPPLMIHFWQNFALTVACWYWGPFRLGELSATTLTTIAGIGLVALAATVVVARNLSAVPQPGPARNAR